MRVTIFTLFSVALALVTIGLQYSSPVEAVSISNAVSNGSQVFCMNKSTGTLRVSASGICKTTTEEPFVFASMNQIGSNGFVPQAICGTSGNSFCGLGSIGPGGGTIFFVDQNNDYPTFTYLEAAPAGWDGKAPKVDPTSTWCNDTTHIVQSSSNPWNSRIVGSGKSNTNTLKASCDQGVATLVNEFNLSKRNKFSDWYIPSLGELILMGTNLQGKAGLGPDDYWSSSEFSDVGGWVQSIGHGYQGNANKATLFHVRPIRAF